jgi:hypothetical protein
LPLKYILSFCCTIGKKKKRKECYYKYNHPLSVFFCHTEWK